MATWLQFESAVWFVGCWFYHKAITYILIEYTEHELKANVGTCECEWVCVFIHIIHVYTMLCMYVYMYAHAKERWRKEWERVSLAGAATSIIFVTTKVLSQQTCVMTKHVFCCDKSMLVATTKNVMTKWCLLQQNFCHNKYLLRQTCVCHNKFCHDKHVFVATKVCLSWQTFCCDKIMLVATNICHDKTFVATIFVVKKNCEKTFDTRSTLLSWQTHVCCKKHVFVTTKLLSQQKLYLWHSHQCQW